MFKTILNYFRKLFIGGPTFITYNGTQIFWPSTFPINSFPINVYMTESARKTYGVSASIAVVKINALMKFKFFQTPMLVGNADLSKIFKQAEEGERLPNLRGIVLIDTEDRLTVSKTTVYYATKSYPQFKEEIGSIRCAFIDMVSDPTKGLEDDTLLHELLHSMGLDHDTETGSVMNEFLSPVEGYIITPKTIAALRAKYNGVSK